MMGRTLARTRACTHTHVSHNTWHSDKETILEHSWLQKEIGIKVWGEIDVMKFLEGGSNTMVKNGHLVTQVSHVRVAIWRTADGDPSAMASLSLSTACQHSPVDETPREETHTIVGTLGNSNFRLKGELQRKPLSAFLLTRTVRWCFSEISGSLLKYPTSPSLTVWGLGFFFFKTCFQPRSSDTHF